MKKIVTHYAIQQVIVRQQTREWVLNSAIEDPNAQLVTITHTPYLYQSLANSFEPEDGTLHHNDNKYKINKITITPNTILASTPTTPITT
jgi:hypothetical protein